MVSRRRAHDDLADLALVADLDLAHVLEAPEEMARPPRRHDRRALAEPPQRCTVEMVVVDMRDQNGVDPRYGLIDVDPDPTAQVQHPPPDQRIGDEPDAVQLDQNGRVADVDEPRRARRAYAAAP